MLKQSPGGKKMKSQKHRHRNKWFSKALHQENSLRYDITSQQKRCFTNLDSWMKLNIFSASLLDLELSDFLHTDVQRCSHHICLPYIKNNNINDFQTKKLWLSGCTKFGLTRVRQQAVLPTYLTVSVVQGGSLAVSRNSQHSEGPLTAAHYTMGIFSVKFFGSSEEKVRCVPNALSTQGCFLRTAGSFIHI